jgi:hypothetical protein
VTYFFAAKDPEDLDDVGPVGLETTTRGEIATTRPQHRTSCANARDTPLTVVDYQQLCAFRISIVTAWLDRFHAIEVRLVALARCPREHRPRAFGGGPWGAQWMVSRLVTRRPLPRPIWRT